MALVNFSGVLISSTAGASSTVCVSSTGGDSSTTTSSATSTTSATSSATSIGCDSSTSCFLGALFIGFFTSTSGAGVAKLFSSGFGAASLGKFKSTFIILVF